MAQKASLALLDGQRGFSSKFSGQHTGANIVEFAFIRNLQSIWTSSAKKVGRDTCGSARCGVRAWWWWRSTFPKSLREWQTRPLLRRSVVQVGSAVRTFGALALLLRSPTRQRELLSQDHPAPPTPPRLYGNRRFVSMMVRVGRRMTKPL